MPHHRSSLGAVAAILLGAPTASAQVASLPPAIDSGRMVRMTTASGQVAGRLLTRYHAGDTTLRFCRYPGSPCEGHADSAAMRTITVASLARLEVANGSQWRRGAMIGGVLGATIGAVGAAALASMRDCWPRCSPKTPIILAGGIAGGAVYGALGALWGSAFPRWESPSTP